MLKKLEFPYSANFEQKDGSKIKPIPFQDMVIFKINELINTVNKLESRLDTKFGIANDKRNEYSKWVGHLCKFWNGDYDCCEYGILESYDDYLFYRPQTDAGTIICFKFCEPIKPNDELIYKG